MSAAAISGLALVALILVPGRAGAFDAVWEASSGVLPDSACPAWTVAVGDTVPALSGGSLRISTTACSRNTYYAQADTAIQIPDSLVVEARLRYGSGTECVGPCGHYRDAAAITITTAPHVGTLFFVGNNEIFLSKGECAGITSAAVATTESAHTYRIVVSGAGVVTVSYDGVPALTGHTYTSFSDHAGTPRILWGEGSSNATGVSYWEFVRHNAHATGCVPTAIGDAMTRPLRVTAVPNPFGATTTLRYAVARATHVRIDIYDASGRWVRRLLDADATPGDHRLAWDGLDAAGTSVRPGEYLYRITTPDGENTGKLLRRP